MIDFIKDISSGELVFGANKYCLCTTGLADEKPLRLFTSRRAAEECMYDICGKHHINVSCTESESHEKKYSNHAGVRFYINRM